MNEPIDVFALFEEGNPVPNPPKDRPQVDATTYLQSLLKADEAQEFSTMPTTSNPRIGLRLAYAAAALVVIGVGWLLFASRDDKNQITTELTSTTTVQSTTTSTEPPATTTVAETTTTVDAEEEAWQAITPWVASFGDGGEFRSTHFHADVRFTVPDGWTRLPGASELPNAVTPFIPPGDLGERGAVFIYEHADDDSVDAWLERMQNHDSVNVLEVVESELGGIGGIEVRFETTDSMIYLMLTDEFFHELDAGQQGVVRVVEVDGIVVSASILVFDGADLPAMEEAGRPLVDSILWRS